MDTSDRQCSSQAFEPKGNAINIIIAFWAVSERHSFEIHIVHVVGL